MTPATHIEVMYNTTPIVDVQKWISIALILCIFFSPIKRGIRQYNEPIVIIATQPKAPECT
jgi:hypothetical protein